MGSSAVTASSTKRCVLGDSQASALADEASCAFISLLAKLCLGGYGLTARSNLMQFTAAPPVSIRTPYTHAPPRRVGSLSHHSFRSEQWRVHLVSIRASVDANQ